MTLPTADALFHVIDQTWPSASKNQPVGWIVREGQGGGNRVSAATRTNEHGEIETAEQAMQSLGQPNLFMIRENDGDLDQELANRDYLIQDPVNLYSAPTSLFTDQSVPIRSAFANWPPLAIQTEIWAQGGIGSARIAIMNRVTKPKTAFLGRTENRASAAAFVAIERKIAMLHALEVSPSLRRKGVGRNILRAAAHWAQDRGAQHISLAVTAANVPANALYCSARMTVVGKYHYRVQKKQETNRGSA